MTLRQIIGYCLSFVCLALNTNILSAQYTQVEQTLDNVSLIEVRNEMTKAKETNNYLTSEAALSQLASKENVVWKHKLIKPSKKKYTSSDLYKRVKKSTLIVVSNTMHATAFVIEESGYCVTNYHVLAQFANKQTFTSEMLLVKTSEGNFYPITEIVTCSKINDIVVFKVDTGNDNLSPLPMGDSAEEGTEIYMMGHPYIIKYFFSKGIVAKNFIREGEPHPGDDFRMAVTTDYSVGTSGGPLVDNNANIIGVVSTAVALYSDNEKKTNPQMVLKSAIPVIALKLLIDIN